LYHLNLGGSVGSIPLGAMLVDNGTRNAVYDCNENVAARERNGMITQAHLGPDAPV
jgi:hypothetical protein